MSAVTPNVKAMVVCDEAIASEIEANVYALEGVRQSFVAPSFPCVWAFNVFLLLDCGRDGTYTGNLRILRQSTDREVRREALRFTLAAGDSYLGTVVPIAGCRFPEPGRYDMQVWFWDGEGREVQKGERSFDVLKEG